MPISNIFTVERAFVRQLAIATCTQYYTTKSPSQSVIFSGGTCPQTLKLGNIIGLSLDTFTDAPESAMYMCVCVCVCVFS